MQKHWSEKQGIISGRFTHDTSVFEDSHCNVQRADVKRSVNTQDTACRINCTVTAEAPNVIYLLLSVQYNTGSMSLYYVYTLHKITGQYVTA